MCPNLRRRLQTSPWASTSPASAYTPLPMDIGSQASPLLITCAPRDIYRTLGLWYRCSLILPHNNLLDPIDY